MNKTIIIDKDNQEILNLINDYMLESKIPRSIVYSTINESYHNSWNYLMQVIEKIQNKDFLIDVVISNNKCIIADTLILNKHIDKHKGYYDEVVGINTFEATLKAVCNFIQHFNKVKYGN